MNYVYFMGLAVLLTAIIGGIFIHLDNKRQEIARKDKQSSDKTK